ncbi:hypothetical protein GLOIN_2v1571258 [Rhizophagus clarus]|uniref:Uncharacterized protein n=1 Tax=Rhizophagus clarus TaxID=94130 RepID=A0A8H3LWC6_9GLOM|nr:hypothetical protein GLOIN_2v1571258 [Rhizophagus clarus]
MPSGRGKSTRGASNVVTRSTRSARGRGGKNKSFENEISDELIRTPLEPIKNALTNNNLNQDYLANSYIANQGLLNNMDQTSTKANTPPIQSHFITDENVDQLPTFNTRSIPKSQYFDNPNKKYNLDGPFYLNTDNLEFSVTDSYSAITGRDSESQELLSHRKAPYNQSLQKDYDLKNYRSTLQSQNVDIYQPQDDDLESREHKIHRLTQEINTYQPQVDSWRNKINRSTLQFREANTYQSQAELPANSYTSTMNIPKFREISQKLLFPDEDSLVNWLSTRPDLITKAQNISSSKIETNIPSMLMDKETVTNLIMEQCKLLFLRTRNPSKEMRENLIMKIVPTIDPISKEFKALYTKTREYFDNFWHTFNRDMASLALVKTSNNNPTNENIKQFIAGKVWKQKLSEYLDASNYTEFKRSSSSLKSLEIFVAESLRIHVEFLIAVQNKKKPSYSEDVLSKIKKLDQHTFQLSIPSASRRNYVNELIINQIDIDMLSEDNE